MPRIAIEETLNLCNDIHSQLKGVASFLSHFSSVTVSQLFNRATWTASRAVRAFLSTSSHSACRERALTCAAAHGRWFDSLRLEPDVNAPDSIDMKPADGATRYAAHAPQRGRHLMDDAEQAARRQRSRRANFVKWLRKVHGWVGLWGAVLGLMFGVTGFLLNHRAGPLKVSTGEPQVDEMQLAVPQKGWHSPAEMTNWLTGELKVDGKPGRVRREPAHAVAWGDRSTVQPEFWQVGIMAPGQNVQAEYWVGNGFVAVKRTQNTFLATMNNLHKGVGLSVGWVLLIDTIAGSLILLSLTGVLLWTELNKRKTVGVVLVAASIVAALACCLA